MDANRFDRLTRRLTTRPASRRLIFGAAPLALGCRFAADEANARKRCKKSKRCGKDCCKSSSCFPKKIDPNNPDRFTLGCCASKRLCLSPDDDPSKDQCCYPDEKCRPNDNNNGNGLCCRTCGDGCCSSAEFCKHGQCKPIGTARLPRRRGGG